MTDQPTRPMREPDEWVPSPRNPEEDALDDSANESRRHLDRMRAHGEKFVADLQAGRVCHVCFSRDVVQGGKCEACEVRAERRREWEAS